MPHQLLGGTDIDSLTRQFRTVFVPEAVRDQIRGKRIRRDQGIPVGLASHSKINLTGITIPDPRAGTAADLSVALCLSNIFVSRDLFDLLVKFVRDRDQPVGIISFRPADMQCRQAGTVLFYCLCSLVLLPYTVEGIDDRDTHEVDAEGAEPLIPYLADRDQTDEA